MAVKKFYRSHTDKIFGGVIGGLGEYFHVDPTLLRIAWVFLLIVSGLIPGILVYIFALIMVPTASRLPANPIPHDIQLAEE